MTDDQGPRADELELALQNRVDALAELAERVCRLEAERAPLEDELDAARREREAAAITVERLEHEVGDLGHRARVAEHELGVLRHESAERIWQLEAENHELRSQLAAATQRAVEAEEHPLRHLVLRARARLQGLLPG